MPKVTTLSALSIRQPYVEQILAGEKQAEYRSWNTTHHGPLLIHASKSVAEPGSKDLPRGVLIGMVDVVAVIPYTDCFAWILRDPVRFKTPIPFVGKVGIFHVPFDLVADVELVIPERSTYSTWSRSMSIR